MAFPSSSPLLPFFLLLSLLLLCSHGLSAEERQSEGMTFTVHRSSVMSDVALSPCDLSVAFVYRERVEDAQVLLDSSLKHQQGICHMHAVFVAWDVPFLAHQVTLLRRLVATRPRSTMLLVKGRLGNVHDLRRLSFHYITTPYAIFADYDILWKPNMAAEMLRLSKTLQPAPFVVLPGIDEVEHSPGLRPEAWQAYIEVGADSKHHPTAFFKLVDQGPNLPLTAMIYDDPPRSARRDPGWGSARLRPPKDTTAVYTDLSEPHAVLINIDMMREANVSPDELWASRLFGRSHYPVSILAITRFGLTSQVHALRANALYMLYSTFTTFADVILYNYRWCPAENAIHAQKTEAAFGFVVKFQRQCMFRSLFYRMELADLSEPDMLPGPDDHASHAALVLTTISSSTYNSFQFVAERSRAVEDLGVSSPPDMSGMGISETLGALGAQLENHPHLAVDVGTDYRYTEEPLNLTMKAALMEAFNVQPVSKPAAKPLDTSLISACLERTRTLAILTGLRESRAQDMALLRSLRGLAGMVVEDVTDGSVQLWFVLRSSRRKSETVSESVDIGAELNALQRAADRLSAAAGDGFPVRFISLDARQRGRYRIPLSKLRVHRWTLSFMINAQLKSKLDKLAEEAQVQTQTIRRSVDLIPAALGSGAERPANGTTKLEACRWSDPGVPISVQDMTAVAELQVRWARMSIVLSESSFESLIAPAVGVQVSVKCRSPLDGGQNVKSYRVLNGQLLFVPSQLSCVGVARGGTALVVRMLGRHTRGANWENQEPRAVYMDTPTVVSLESAGNQDVLFNATRHFRLLHVRTVTLMTKDPFDSQQNGSDELYLPTEGKLEVTSSAPSTSTGGAGSAVVKPSTVSCRLRTRSDTPGRFIAISFHAWQ